MDMRRINIFIVSVMAVFLFFAFPVNAQKKVYRASTDSDGVQRVEIVGGEYYFDPEHIIVRVNVPVEITFTKTPGFTPHNILIKAPEAGIDVNVDMSTKPATVRFTPSKTGLYPIYCDKRFLFFKTHRERGMEGVLEVVE